MWRSSYGSDAPPSVMSSRSWCALHVPAEELEISPSSLHVRSINRSPSSRGSPTASIFNYMERWYLLPLFLCETLPAFVTQDGPGGLQRRDWPGRVQGFRSVQGFQSILFLRFKTRRRRHCVRVTYSGTRRSVKLSNWLACRLAKKSTSIKLPRNIC